MNTRRLIAAAFACLATVALAQPKTYRCGNVFQQTPCDTRTQERGSEIRVFNDQPSDRDLYDAELRRVASFPNVAKYPDIFYALDVDSWYGMRIANGRTTPVGGAMSDPDVIRLNGALRQKRLQERLAAIDRDYDEKVRQIRVQAERRQRSFEVEWAASNMRRACRGAFGYNAPCEAARDAHAKAESALKAAGGAP